MMCISKVPQACVICLVFSHLLHSIDCQHAEHGQTTLSNQKHDTEDINKIVTTLNYKLERPKISVEKRQFFISKLFEKYGTGVKLPFEGFEHMLAHIRLGNLSFPDHNLTGHKINSSTVFMSIHSDHVHIPALSNKKHCDKAASASEHSRTFNTESQNTAALSVNGRNLDNNNQNSNLVQKSDLRKKRSTENNTNNLSQRDEKTNTSQLQGNSIMNHSSEVPYPFNVEHRHSMDPLKNNSSNKLENIPGHLNGLGKQEIGNSSLNRHLTRLKRRQAENDTDENKCLTPQEIWKSFDFGIDDEITMSDFLDICPALIYHLDNEQCLDFSMVVSYDQEGHCHGEEPKQKVDSTMNNYQISEIPAKVWGFSCLAIVIISVVGLLGVAVIPLINKMFYKHLLNFLVALAVGALTGDALLHLLPHALKIDDEGHSHEGKDGGHDIGGVLKGLSGLGGIYFFFLIEKILTILTEFKRRQKKKRQTLSREDTYDDQSLPRDFREMSAVADKDLCRNIQDMSDKKSSKSSHQELYHGNNGEETANMLDKSEFSRSHSHSHSHHSDEFPNSVAAIAWMVILGDGMHNLSDGLAIGAAFGASISSGFSTSIAVFCHELPHEIGDFAMLLKSGMTVKQAIFYNVVSSILSFIGMVIGVMLGNVTSARLWIFAVVAGMFLYIALVDMLPEIKNSAHEGMVGKQLCDLFIQSAGMFLGAGVMFFIAIYEDKIQTAFDPV
ncbi:hypothetical protein CHS0354_019000 [Potamilus streckersoni]|nr:hypothetical protein CHS0354_019000 [Potamilus streckersoni]